MTIEIDFLGSSRTVTLGITPEGTVAEMGETGPLLDTWDILDDGERVATIDVQPQGDALFVDAITSQGGPGTLGPAKVRQAFRILLQEYPGAKRIIGKRVTGTRAAQRETIVGDFGVPEIIGDVPETSVRVR